MAASATVVELACRNLLTRTLTTVPAAATLATLSSSTAVAAASEAGTGSSPAPAEEKKGKSKAAKMIEVEPIKGTRDFVPADMRVQTWLFDCFRETARRFGFEEYDAPILESDELYKRKKGEEITEQMYCFVDKGGRGVALRPEMTPSLARLVLKEGRALPLPVKWFSIPQCWRYENTTRGRRREHYQWNVDIFGEPSVAAEAEIIAAAISFMQMVGLSSSDVGIRINSRKVLQSVLAPLGIEGDMFSKVCVVVDKLDKIGADGVREQLAALEISGDVIQPILTSLSISDIGALSALLGDQNEAVQEINQLFSLLGSYGFADWLQFDASVVRGLSYYTGVVFEGFDRGGNLRAICGGGRYDKLLSTYGAKEDIPACGFGFGDCVIVELLKDKNLLPAFKNTMDYFIIPFSANEVGESLKILSTLRSKGARADVYLKYNQKIKVGKAYEMADRVGAAEVVLVAPDELARGCVKVKTMAAAEGDAKETELTLDSLYARFGSK